MQFFSTTFDKISFTTFNAIFYFLIIHNTITATTYNAVFLIDIQWGICSITKMCSLSIPYTVFLTISNKVSPTTCDLVVSICCNLLFLPSVILFCLITDAVFSTIFNKIIPTIRNLVILINSNSSTWNAVLSHQLWYSIPPLFTI